MVCYKRLIWVLDCLELCVPTVWNSTEGVFQQNDMWGKFVTILQKVLEWYNYRTSEISEVCVIFHLLCEHVAWIYDSWDIIHVKIFWLMKFAKPYFIWGLSAWWLWGPWSLPLNVCLVVVVYLSPSKLFWNSDVVGTMLQVLEFSGALAGGHDFGFTGTEGGLILMDWFPCNWDPIASEEKTR